MFLDFYQMREDPFGVTPDPRFLYLGDSHREALSMLFDGIEADRGFMVLIANPGLGKTTLIYRMIDELQPNARTVLLFQTQCNSRELMQYLLSELGVDIDGMETVSMHRKLSQILAQERQAGRRFVLIIDEAHNLEPGVLETVRLLSNFETPRSKLLQIVLVGQPQLARKLASPALEQLQQRISMFAKLEAFGPEETARYIDHRLKLAGYAGGELFTSGAMEIIAEQSKGIPRNINRLCFRALSMACAMGRKQVHSKMMWQVVAGLEMEPSEREPELIPPPPRRAAVKPVRPAEPYPPEPRFRVPTWATRPPRWAKRLPRWAKQPPGWVMRLPGWAPIAAAMAASFVIVTVFAFHSHGTAGQSVQATSAASAAVQNTSALPKPVQATTAPTPTPSPSDAADPASTPSVAPEAPPKAEPATVKVIVRPGETLKQIALRTLGQDDDQLMQQILQLNHITDPDHIEPDQELRLPQISKATVPPPGDGTNDLSGKN